jgi:hypothetical protein
MRSKSSGIPSSHASSSPLGEPAATGTGKTVRFKHTVGPGGLIVRVTVKPNGAHLSPASGVPTAPPAPTELAAIPGHTMAPGMTDMPGMTP